MANNLTVKDGAGASQTLKTTDSGGVHTPHHNVDVLPSLPAGTNAIGKLAANSGVDIGDVDILSIAPGDNNIGNVDIASIAAGDANIGNVDIVTGPTGANALQVQGTVAHDSAAANSPVPMAGRAANAAVTAVANADVSHIMTDLNGKQVVVPYAVPELFVSGVTAAITDTTRTSVIAAGAAGVRHYITSIIVTNSHATVGTFVKIEDGTTEKFTGYAAAVGGGFAISLPVPLVGTAATAWNASCVTTGANVVVSLVGYKAP